MLRDETSVHTAAIVAGAQVDDVLMFDMGANWSWRRLGVNVNIHNIFGKKFYQTGVSLGYNRPLQGLWLLVELTYKI